MKRFSDLRLTEDLLLEYNADKTWQNFGSKITQHLVNPENTDTHPIIRDVRKLHADSAGKDDPVSGVSTHLLITLGMASLGLLIGTWFSPFTFIPALFLSSVTAGAYFAREAAQVIENDHWFWPAAFKAVFSTLDNALQGALPMVVPLGIILWVLVI